MVEHTPQSPDRIQELTNRVDAAIKAGSETELNVAVREVEEQIVAEREERNRTEKNLDSLKGILNQDDASYERVKAQALEPFDKRIAALGKLQAEVRSKLRELTGWKEEDVKAFIAELQAGTVDTAAPDFQRNLADALKYLMTTKSAAPDEGAAPTQAAAGADAKNGAAATKGVVEPTFRLAPDKPRSLAKRAEIAFNDKIVKPILERRSGPLFNRLEKKIEKNIKDFMSAQGLNIDVVERVLNEHKGFDALGRPEQQAIMPILLAAQELKMIRLTEQVPEATAADKKLAEAIVKETERSDGEKRTVEAKKAERETNYPLIRMWIRLHREQIKALPYVEKVHAKQTDEEAQTGSAPNQPEATTNNTQPQTPDATPPAAGQTPPAPDAGNAAGAQPDAAAQQAEAEKQALEAKRSAIEPQLKALGAAEPATFLSLMKDRGLLQQAINSPALQKQDVLNVLKRTGYNLLRNGSQEDLDLLQKAIDKVK